MQWSYQILLKKLGNLERWIKNIIYYSKVLLLQKKAKYTFYSLLESVSLNVMKNTYKKNNNNLIPPNYFQAICTKTCGVELIAGKSYLVGRDPLVCFY